MSLTERSTRSFGVRAQETPIEAVRRYKQLSVQDAVGSIKLAASRISITDRGQVALRETHDAIEHAWDVRSSIKQGPTLKIEVVAFGRSLSFIHLPDVRMKHWPLLTRNRRGRRAERNETVGGKQTKIP